MSLIESIKNFFIKGRGVLLGFPLIFLGAALFMLNKILGLVAVTIGIIFLTMSDYVIEHQDESEDEVIGRELPGEKANENETSEDNIEKGDIKENEN